MIYYEILPFQFKYTGPTCSKNFYISVRTVKSWEGVKNRDIVRTVADVRMLTIWTGFNDILTIKIALTKRIVQRSVIAK